MRSERRLSPLLSAVASLGIVDSHVDTRITAVSGHGQGPPTDRNKAVERPHSNGSYWFDREAHGNWARFLLPDGRRIWLRSAYQPVGKDSPPGPNPMEGDRYPIRNYLIRHFGHFTMAELQREYSEHLYE